MLRSWLEPQSIKVPEEFVHAIGGNPLVSRVLFLRGLKDIPSAKGFLSPDAYCPTPSTELTDLSTAVEILLQAISNKNTIGVWGDFDVDGQTSTTVLVSALHELGGNVVYHIPVRAEESHGINLPALKIFIRQGVELILTCDTGISASEEIEYLYKTGIRVIITDHHDLPEVLPKAEAIINPKILPMGHPLSTLPGVGVAYKLVEELWHRSGDDEKSQQYLDLVALGIIADIALLTGDTRYLLQLGLAKLRRTKRLGLLAMMEYAELNQANLTEEHIGYILAPRMNAIGRLDDANSMVELLTTKDIGRARVLALELEGMNAKRKLLSDQIYQAAEAQLNTDPKLLDFPVLVLSHPTWPAGVIGIVASRLVEQYHRPVILFSSPPGEIARGSARSIETINITSAIGAHRSLLRGYGGHPMAAGLAIDPELITDFRNAISRTIQDMGLRVQTEKALQIDGYLALPQLSLELIEDFERLAPFGAGNPPLVFATRDLKLTGYVAVGRSNDHLLLTIEDELGHSQQSIWWQGAGYSIPETKFDLAYSVRTSTYGGQREVQIEWIDYRLPEPEIISLESKEQLIEVIDFRDEPEPVIKINDLQSKVTLQIWGEAKVERQLSSTDRFSLSPAGNLAIWTIPPGPDVLESVLKKVKPKRVYLFGIDPGMDKPETFLKRLVGLVKSRIKTSDGITDLSMLACATSQRIQTIKAGLEWLQDHGYICLEIIDHDRMKIAAGNEKKNEDTKTSSACLNALLAESAAFRRYFKEASKERLLIFDDEN
jgi:single-stranded-DNA-specific exonuclease